MVESLFPSVHARREGLLRLVVPPLVHEFDVRGIAARLREPALIGAIDALRVGETLSFVDDQDVLPLLRRTAERFGREVEFEFRENTAQRVVIEFSKCRAV